MHGSICSYGRRAICKYDPTMRKALYLLIIPFLFACDTSGSSDGHYATSTIGGAVADAVQGGDVSVDFQPVFLPIKFSLSSKGIKASFSQSLVTFIGTFSLSYSRDVYKNRPNSKYAKPAPIAESSMYQYYEFKELNIDSREKIKSFIVNQRDLVVAVIRSDDQVDLFVIDEAASLLVVTEGITRSTISKDYHEIDARHAKVRELVLTVNNNANKQREAIPNNYADPTTIPRDILNDPSDIVDKRIKSMSEITARSKDYELVKEGLLTNVNDSLKQQKRSPY